MSRPTERAAPGVESLRDSEVADWLEARERAALFFWDAEDDASRRQRTRVELAAAAAGVAVGAVNVRTDALVAQALGVKSVPTLIIFRGGEVADRVMGGAPEAILLEALGA